MGDTLERVRRDNAAAMFLCRLLRAGIPALTEFIIENPRYSFLWKLPDVQHLGEAAPVHEVVFDMCCYGAARTRSHLSLSTIAELTEIAATCRHLHAHDE